MRYSMLHGTFNSCTGNSQASKEHPLSLPRVLIPLSAYWQYLAFAALLPGQQGSRDATG